MTGNSRWLTEGSSLRPSRDNTGKVLGWRVLEDVLENVFVFVYEVLGV